nr:PREDICTED: b(0,+)-type amino acid transporter 1-like [Latimeria chalumnae]|eukprot:XP_014346983.1 PREDICTED: b(0,+)-type amino acid transporter 1-like [Latimeria chalumnae]
MAFGHARLGLEQLERHAATALSDLKSHESSRQPWKWRSHGRRKLHLNTAAKLSALLTIVIGGLVLLVKGHTTVFQNAFQGTDTNFGSAGMAFYQGLWAYSGWNTLSNVTEELKHPEVNFLRAILIAVPLVTFLYLLVNVSYFTAMTPAEIISGAAAVTWGNKVLGSWAWLMPLSVAVSTFGGVNASLFTGGRTCYVAAREGHMPEILSMIHVRHLTPSPAIIYSSVISLIVIIPGNFGTLVNLCSFTGWLFHGLTLAGLLYTKIKRPDLASTNYKVTILIPIVLFIAAIGLMLAPVISSPRVEYLYVAIFVLSGVVVHAFFIHFKLCPGLLRKLTLFLQLLLEVSPTHKTEN